MLEALLPLMLVGIVALTVPPAWLTRPVVKYALLSGMAVILVRYLWWRLTVTVLPASELSAQSTFIWALFAVELLAWADSCIFFAALARQTDRTPEADRHEARLRGLGSTALPVVDVFIATYNEPLEVLEKTIVGALALDWPREKLRVWVLDDGRRAWLRAFAEAKGAGYLTREGNAHAKAGNINAAIARTSGEFFLVLDADFIPRQDFLFRTMGFFADPSIGIVQVPHSFFNHDPMQTNLALQSTLPDDQRLFFDVIMPGRDGWDCAFCCGSNSVTRRTAIEAVGGGLPSGSITEDMLLTLALLRKGYRTRYLSERLAVGLAAESLAAFFVQRARWARGGIQILFLKEGPLGPGLTLVQRLMFLPTHWLTQSLTQVFGMATPAIFLWTGLMPFLNSTPTTMLSYQAPAIVGTIVLTKMLAPGKYFLIPAMALALLQSVRLLPTVIATLLRPHGHAFKVTPKGSGAGSGSSADRRTLVFTLGLIVATALGLLVNSVPGLQIVGSASLVPVVALWGVLNMVVLLVAATTAVSPPALRTEERFPVDEPCRVATRRWDLAGEVTDLSLTGAMIRLEEEPALGEMPISGDWVLVHLAGVGRIAGEVRRVLPVATGTEAETVALGVRFHLPVSARRDALIRKLFTEGLDNSTTAAGTLAVTFGILAPIFQREKTVRPQVSQPLEPPAWILACEAEEDRLASVQAAVVIDLAGGRAA